MNETANLQAVSTGAETIEKTIEAAEEKREYTLRELQAKDVFIMTKIIGAIGVEEFKRVFSGDFINSITTESNGNENDIASAVGVEMFFEIAGIVCNNMPKCEQDVYTFISNLSGIPAKEVEALPMNTFTNIIIDIIKKDEFKDFIGVVSKLFK